MFFLLFWFIVSAIISAFEQSYDEHVDESKEEITGITELLKKKKELFENNTVMANQLEMIITTMEDSPDMERLWDGMNIKVALVQHDMIETMVDVMKDEFVRVRGDLTKDDTSGKNLANKSIKLLSDKSTVAVLREAVEEHVKEQKRCKEKKANGERCSPEGYWTFGNPLHYTSTVFTTLGYGAHTPVTTIGKFVCIFLIIFQIPFFLHCIATTATLINTKLDSLLGLSTKHQDLESMGAETANTQQRRLVLLKGLLILVGILLVHMLVAAVYHYCTTGWPFGDVLYFEFVRISSVGFGDMIPEDEYTLAGAIFKNILVNIPSQIVTFAIFVRALPIIS